MAVIIVLATLLVGAVGAFICYHFYRRHKKNKPKGNKYHATFWHRFITMKRVRGEQGSFAIFTKQVIGVSSDHELLNFK